MYYVSHFEYDKDIIVYNNNLNTDLDLVYATYKVYIPVERRSKDSEEAKVGSIFKVKLDKIYTIDKTQLKYTDIESFDDDESILSEDNDNLVTYDDNIDELLKQREEKYSQYVQIANPGDLSLEISNISPDFDNLSFIVGLFVLPNEDYKHLSNRVKDVVAEAYISYYEDSKKFHEEVIKDYYEKHLKNIEKLDNILNMAQTRGVNKEEIDNDQIFGLDGWVK